MKIRLWTLGSLEHKITPTQEGFAKLRELIESKCKEDGVVDIMWGPELSCQVIDTGLSGEAIRPYIGELKEFDQLQYHIMGT